ncbi:MAG: hypothetical protein KDC66_18420 [Phaeodactylibacter sp.]|nr:hypothetical protein [Phaeodactylibacter sp.]MCB9273069.1 hypothetical protein [Lewinellaceae bacterium]
MKRPVAFFLLLALGLFSFLPTFGQRDLFDGLLDREGPEFHSTILPSDEDGVIRLAVYFTHPKLSAIEASFWIKDHGSNLMSSGTQRLVRGLQQMGNRQQDTLVIRGLDNRHFYSIGIDYRNASSINRKFSSQALHEGYFYTNPEKSEKLATATPAQEPEKPAAPATTPKSEAGAATTPCLMPELYVKIDPSGYCGEENRPAVLIQCENCQGRNWEFSVEVRKGYGSWEPIRRDGQRQPAVGTAMRTEPLCLLAPGSYKLQVLAWGENCQSPVAYNIGTTVDIAGDEPRMAAQPMAAAPQPAIPDTCSIMAQAVLLGDKISGTLELPAGALCAEWNPIVSLSYVNPSYRNITIGEIPLYPGQPASFSVQLEDRDLYRGIHTLQAVVYGRSANLPQRVPIYSFWIRAFEEDEVLAAASNGQESAYGRDWESRSGNIAQKGNGLAEESAFGEEAPAMEENFQEVQVKASDPNCTQIQNLQLVYSPTQPDKPLYISWLNPRCCQEEGCEYSVWTGKDPGQLQLLVKGRKPGANITELLQGVESGSQYFEIVVRTPNGARKAAFVPGEGPKYGIDEILEYHDRLKPQSGTPVVGMKETTVKGDVDGGKKVVTPNASGLEGGLAGRMGSGNPEIAPYEEPELSVKQFEPCRIYRETHVIGNKPIRDGDELTIEYDYSDKAYRYTLYLLPEGGSDWVLAPGTKELQGSPSFELTAHPFMSGKYVILACKPDKSWGCLSAPLSAPLEIRVME